MNTRATMSIIIASAGALAACGGSYPAPSQRMADAQSAERGAQELGAANLPQAELHLTLAHEQIEKAKLAMNDGDNKRADFLLVRAKGDAELALALAREAVARVEAQRAIEQANALRQSATNSNNSNQGAQP